MPGRYLAKGTTKFFYVPTIASTSLIPTAAEVNAGTNLAPNSPESLSDVSGFTFANSPANVPDFYSTFVGNIPGEDTVDTSSMMFYDASVHPIKTVLAKGVSGYIVVFAYGTAGALPAAGDKCDVWPITVASNSRAYTAANEAAKYNVVFACTAPPGIEKTLT